MSNWNTQKVKTLKKRWADITSGRNVSDHTLATWAQRTTTALADGEFLDFCTSPKGLGLHSNTARSYERMSRSLDLVPESDVWKAVGWQGVRRLCRIEKAKERTALCRWVTTRAKKQPVTESALTTRIEEKAKSYKPVGGSGGGSAGKDKDDENKGTTKRSLQRACDRLTKDNDELTVKSELLKEELTRVIAKWPVIKNDLSPAVIVTLGLEGGQLPRVKTA